MDPRYSNYPRANMSGPTAAGYAPGQRPPGAHFEFISDAFNIIRADVGTWILATIISLVVTIVAALPIYGLSFGVLFVGGSGGPTGPAQMAAFLAGGILLYVVLLTVSGMTYVGMGAMAMQASRGERPQIGELFAPLRRFFPVAITTLIVSLLIILGLSLFVLPGLIAIGLFAMAPFAACEQELSPGDALRWSLSVSREHVWSIMGLLVVAFIIAQIGGCACYVGYLFTGPVPGIVLGLTYMTFRAPAPAPFMPYPPSGPVPPPTEMPPPVTGL